MTHFHLKKWTFDMTSSFCSMKKNNSMKLEKNFTRILVKWNRDKNDRSMPWKGESDPYKIWLSEIIMQQTRVEQGLAYYQKFVAKYPDIHKLAKASDEQVFKLWEGLGYYSRCRNLLYTARYISKERDGIFPETFEEINSLRGVGPYTASAIASFAFNKPYAVLDGNVFRVLARVFGINASVDTSAGKKIFSELADSVLDKKNPGVYNQAIMDFGAVVCKPALPLCNLCVLKNQCVAFQNEKIGELPLKKKKGLIKLRYFNYLVIEYQKKTVIVQRTKKDIWQGLFEFPLIETKKEITVKALKKMISEYRLMKNSGFKIEAYSEQVKQQLSHQLIKGRFIKIKLTDEIKGNKDWIWVNSAKLKQYSFPKIIHQYFELETK